MVVFQLVGCAMANQIACWVTMKKDAQQNCNHLQIGSRFILIRRPIRIIRTSRQLLCLRKLLLRVSWLVFHSDILHFSWRDLIFQCQNLPGSSKLLREISNFSYSFWVNFLSDFLVQNLTESSEETSPSPAELITSLPGQADSPDSPEALITTSFDNLLIEAEMIQITTQPTLNKDHKNHPKNIIYSVETIFIENHSKFLNFNFFLILTLFILIA